MFTNSIVNLLQSRIESSIFIIAGFGKVLVFPDYSHQLGFFNNTNSMKISLSYNKCLWQLTGALLHFQFLLMIFLAPQHIASRTFAKTCMRARETITHSIQDDAHGATICGTSPFRVMAFLPPQRLNQTYGLDIRSTTRRQILNMQILINVHTCSRFIHNKMAMMHKANGLYKTRNCLSMRKKFPCTQFLKGTKRLLHACNILF